MSWFDREMEVKRREWELLKALELRRITANVDQPHPNGRLRGLWRAAFKLVTRRQAPVVMRPVVLPSGHPAVDGQPCPACGANDAA